MNELIKALRCISINSAECNKECNYYNIEEIAGKLISMADFEKDGKYYVMYCDRDRIGREAADMLEKYEELKKRIFETCRNEGIKIKVLPEGEEKSKHAYACKSIFRILRRAKMRYKAEVTERTITEPDGKSNGSSKIITIAAKNKTDAAEMILKNEATKLWAAVKDASDLLKFKVTFEERTAIAEFKNYKTIIIRVYPPEEV